MPGFTIGGIGGNGDIVDHESRFYASYNWEIPDIMTIVGKMLLSGGSGSQKQTSTILLKTAQLPSVSFEVVKAKGGAQDYKYAGKPSFDNIKITFYDTYGLGSGLKRWSESVYNKDDGIRTANHYKANTKIRKFLVDAELTPGANGQGKPTGTVEYELFGSWPQMVKESDLTYVEASIKTVDVTLCYDHFVMSHPS